MGMKNTYSNNRKDIYEHRKDCNIAELIIPINTMLYLVGFFSFSFFLGGGGCSILYRRYQIFKKKKESTQPGK
jgi:hypothetical protein